MLQAETISHHRDEFAVRGFCFRVGNRVAEQGGNGIDIAPVPGYFNGVTDSSFDAGSGRIIFCGDIPDKGPS